MKKNKVIFLDFDGVIADGTTIDPALATKVGDLAKRTESGIVIISSWRRDTLEKTLEYISPNFTCPELVVGITSRMFSFKFGHRESHYRIPRGVEIDRYIQDNDIDQYVIIDDVPDLLLGQMNNYVCPVEGYITEADLREAERILE